MTNHQSPISNIQSQLESVYPKDEAEALAWWIAEETTGLSRTQLLIGCKDTTFFSNTQDIIERLLHFEPIQYIFGHTLWYGLDLKVTPATLIPRPETADMVEQITNHQYPISNTPLRVLDLCTGSGCIAIAIKKQHPDWEVTGIDISAEAIEVAKENAIRNGVHVEFLVMDILSDEFDDFCTQTGSQMPYDIIVSNPPYVCESEKASMCRNVLDYEPETALFVPDNDPLRFYRRIAETALPMRSGQVWFEINEAFPDDVIALLQHLGYESIRLYHDSYGKPRIIQAGGAQ